MNSIEILAQPLPAVTPLAVTDNNAANREIFLANEQPLTIYVNRVEIVTLMTMGSAPAYLVVGFLLNQNLIDDAGDIVSIHVDWSVNAAAVVAKNVRQIAAKTEKRVVTSGCGQGTMFQTVMEQVYRSADNLSSQVSLTTTAIYQLLVKLSTENAVYRQAGGVHGCALCTNDSIIKVIEDVGRHNAVDSLSGFMALEETTAKPTIMYTTGRLTSEMVIKTAQMGVPIIISRSGATSMGVEIAKAADITLISRANGKRFLLLSGAHRVEFSKDAGAKDS